MREHDITVPYLSDSILPRKFVGAFNYWTVLSKLQVQVVEQLYSPQALRQTGQERSRRAASLASELDQEWTKREKASLRSPHSVLATDLYWLGI